MNQEIAQRITRARTGLVIDQPFIGVLALRLRLIEEPSIPTLAVDGKSIFYNPQFIEGLTHELLKSAVAHEVMHCVFDHFARRDNRDPQQWNRAGDYVINATLKDAGFELGDSWLYDSAFDGMTTDHVYSLLPPPKNGDGKDSMDECRDGATEDSTITSNDWKIATAQAANAAKACGKLPGSLERFVEEMLTPKVDWRAVLRRFITERSKDDYTWNRPNRRFMHHGFFLPSLYSENMGEIVVAIDTSGSIDAATLNAFGSEIKAIVQSTRPAKTTVVYCDSAVNHVDEFGPNDELHFKPHGGGGTAFKPVMDCVAEKGITPVCLVYLTDLYGDHTFAPPDYPVLWCCTSKEVASFGETIAIEI